MNKLLFVTKNPFIPDSSGGAQKSALYLFKSLLKRGWEIEVICATSIQTDRFRKSVLSDMQKLRRPRRFSLDIELGYPCWRHLLKFSSSQDWLNLLNWRLKEYCPDIVLGDSSPNCPLLSHTMTKGFNTFYFGRNINITRATSILPNDLHLFANSPFVASIISQIMSKHVEVILPFVDVHQYQISEHTKKYITFINPVPEKGVDIAIQVAKALPNEKFLFVKGKWSHVRPAQMEEYLKPAYDLPNIEIWENQSDMREVYKVTDILLVPSQFIETFGRVILEAQINRIPVIGADGGGIPYTLGQGGFLANPKHKPESYIEAIKMLRSSKEKYDHISELAFQNSQRPEFEPQGQVDRFVNYVETVVNSST